MVVVSGGFKIRVFLGIHWNHDMLAVVVGGFKIRVFLGIHRNHEFLFLLLFLVVSHGQNADESEFVILCELLWRRREEG